VHYQVHPGVFALHVETEQERDEDNCGNRRDGEQRER
jgi:hypothetical protein